MFTHTLEKLVKQIFECMREHNSATKADIEKKISGSLDN